MMKTNLNVIRYLLGVVLLLGLIFGQSGWLINSSAENAAVKEINQNQSLEQVQKSIGSLPVYFEENLGQQNPKVRYLTRGGGTTMFLTATEAVYVLRSPKSGVESPKSEDENNELQTSNPEPPLERAVALYMRLADANPNAEFVGQEQLAHLTNYFKGSDSHQWQTGIKKAGEIQYDFMVAPSANPSQIEWEIEGAEQVSVEADGSLLIETEVGVMKQGKPFSYQASSDNIREEVGSRWSVVRRNTVGNQTTFAVGFEIGEYDRTKTLVIDPTVMFSSLAYSTFLGGGGSDPGNAIAVDSLGNAYVTGQTDSTTFPTVAGGFDRTPNGGFDAFATKLNATGSALTYSTFLGGSDADEGRGIAVDSTGNAYLTGFTDDGATDYPTTAGAFDTTHNGNTDAFATKLNTTGSALIYSTFLGGSSHDFGLGIAVDSAGNAYLTGRTDDGTTDYPTTAGAFDTTHNGGGDAFVTKLNATGSALTYSTFLGGSVFDGGRGIV
ncbi:MAG: SBBP repeat-containing protein, partial [Acidobacteria bacterium]|nr:SBBP repeat-containing protein [Acidobacteriota bacterium]